MSEYTFTLTYQLPNAGEDPEALVERLAEAGCDDALVGTGVPGRIALEFTRDASSAWEAVATALRDVKRAVPGAKLIEAAPDFVGVTDIALVLGTSRQYVRKLMLSHGDSFPPPVHGGSASIWHLAEVLEWLAQRKGHALERTQLETARAALEVNLVKETQRFPVKADNQLDGLIA
ncbi:helix-turn-helix transcriptional regulator [Aquisalimonas asiatica]|uniref:Transcriptional regulator, AlpA family n=1 Tax=Aquisalimonas asiatica TaxID=406100 RepID=A0A1H8SNX1_9GAMM|nr:DNA-binding protein [Aquisalimonas asiatica]SEO80659.1 transcriptional regulator, AlpA family [Aquisalimonas asiatica]